MHPHSIKSNIPIWRCVWCGKRKGKLTEDEIELLEDWLHRFGWTMEPLVFHEDGMHLCALPVARAAGSHVRPSTASTVSCQRCRQTTPLSTATAFLEKANALWPEAEVTLRSKRVLSLIEHHDDWLKDRGWYDIITATLDENWKGEDDGAGYIYDPNDSATD